MQKFLAVFSSLLKAYVANFFGCIKLFSSDTGKCRKWTTGKVCAAIPRKLEICFNVLKHLGRSPAARIEGSPVQGCWSVYLISGEAEGWCGADVAWKRKFSASRGTVPS